MTFQQKQAELFYASFVAEVLAREIRSSQGLKGPITYEAWQQMLREKYPKELATFEAARQLRIKHVVSLFVPDTSIRELEEYAMPEAMRLSNEIKISADELRYFFITGKQKPEEKVTLSSSSDGNGVFWSYGTMALLPAGTYLQVRPNMKSRELAIRFREAIITSKGLAGDELDFTHDNLNSEERESNYLLIEKWLKRSEYDRAEVYANALFTAALDGALDEVIEKNYPDREDDDSFVAKLRQKIKNDYYAVAKNYHLPTVSDISSLFRVMLH